MMTLITFWLAAIYLIALGVLVNVRPGKRGEMRAGYIFFKMVPLVLGLAMVVWLSKGVL